MTTIVITTKANPTRTTPLRPPPIDVQMEQMPGSELAVMVQGCVNFKAQGEREKARGGDHGKDPSARLIALNMS